MAHGVYQSKFSRDKSQRKALLRALCDSVLYYGYIETTIAKAKAIKPVIEKIVTRARGANLHDIREIKSYLYTDRAYQNLKEAIVPAIGNRNGGYLRITRTGTRKGDAAEMALLSFVDKIEINNK